MVDNQLDLLLTTERSLLGTLLLHANTVGDVAQMRPEDFHEVRHQLIFRGIIDSYNTSGTTDPLVVGEELSRSGRLQEAGGVEHLLDLVEQVVTPAGVLDHARIVQEHAERRRLRALAQRSLVALDDGCDADAVRSLMATAAPSEAVDESGTDDWLSVASEPPLEWIIPGVIPRAGLIVLAGHPKAGKSLVALDLVLRLAHGSPWFGRAARPASALYISGEGGGGMGPRLLAWRAAHPGERPADGQFLAIQRQMPNLTTPRGVADLRQILFALVRQHGHAPDVVVVDTFARATAGADENDSAAVGAVVAALDALRDEFRCAVVVVHHLRKITSERGNGPKPTMHDLRGSGALVGAADVVVVAAAKDDTRTLHAVACRDGEEWAPINYRLNGQATGRTLEGGRTEFAPVVLPAAPVVAAVRPASDPHADADAMVAHAVDTLRAMGGAPSKTAITVRMSGRRDARFAAVDVAMARGAIQDRGKQVPRFIVATAPHSPPPHTPPGAGSGRPGRSAVGCSPLPA